MVQKNLKPKKGCLKKRNEDWSPSRKKSGRGIKFNMNFVTVKSDEEDTTQMRTCATLEKGAYERKYSKKKIQKLQRRGTQHIPAKNAKKTSRRSSKAKKPDSVPSNSESPQGKPIVTANETASDYSKKDSQTSNILTGQPEKSILTKTITMFGAMEGLDTNSQ